MTWLITLGDWIRDQTASRSKRAVDGLLDYQHKLAWVRRGREKVSVPVREIAVGDIVVVYDGEMIPVDRRVVSGRATVDQRAITGEAMTVMKGRGDKLFAASVVQEGKLYLHTERVAEDSLAADIVRLVESAPTGETRMHRYSRLGWQDRSWRLPPGRAILRAALLSDGQLRYVRSSHQT